jgi:alginate O-acetyltransferase complex protein AlgI
MLFSSNIFLFLFLPLYLLLYFSAVLFSRTKWGSRLFPTRTFLPNLVLLLLSLFFYYWCSGKFILVFFLSILVNTLLGRWIFKSGHRQAWLLAGIVFNLGILIYFKYYNFFYDQITWAALQVFHRQLPAHTFIFLPVGISFYTFMAISYIVEVYQNKEKYANLLHFGTYLTLFPHLVAGPIVRFSELEKELHARDVTLQMFFDGIWRFSLGLGKKVILANSLGSVADKIFALPTSELTTGFAWVAVACYTLQIYFDFSGYSDMAIGLARFFGFHFPENFNQPYQSKNVTEFWRRWHMTLSRWFKDYLYIGLGGNRHGTLRTYVNLFLVFLLCGLWHGASWTFVIWGIYHGLILVAERVASQRFQFRTEGLWGNAWTLLLVMIGWVFFRSASFTAACDFLRAMAGMPQLQGFQYFSLGYYLDAGALTYLILGGVLVLVPQPTLQRLAGKIQPRAQMMLRGIVSIALLGISVLVLSKTQFNPFIYFQF